jgi:hypothetical protein
MVASGVGFEFPHLLCLTPRTQDELLQKGLKMRERGSKLAINPMIWWGRWDSNPPAVPVLGWMNTGCLVVLVS